MILRLYSIALAFIAPIMWLLLWRRARREGGDWDILGARRFGRYRTAAGETGRLWVHAVSLGETRAAKPLIDALLADGVRLLLTHTTATAMTESARQFGAAIASGQLQQAWLPYDFPGAMRRFLGHFRPRAAVLIEREVWPNLVAQANAAGVPVSLVSARLSARSASTMLRLGRLMRPAFAGLSQVLAQTADDAARLQHAGARESVVVGNLKFDIEVPAQAVQMGAAWRAGWGRPVVAIASTRDGEEAHFIRAVAARDELPGNPLFLLIPRHPQRFDEVADLLRRDGARFERRSAFSATRSLGADTRWLLGDSVGEMPAYYAASDVAIIGGSFLDFGGQNLVEASACGVPVIVGPHTRNFAQAADDAIKAGAARRVADAGEAVATALALLEEAPQRQAMAQAAQTFIATHRGATRRVMSALRPWR